MNARRAPLPGDRWHFAHGPIDLVISADGDRQSVDAAHEAAWQRFVEVLSELVAELPLLRLPVGERNPLAGRVARRMWRACAPFRREGLTPMAAVAGAVAQEIVHAYRREGITRAWVNNGGDIALHLVPGASVDVGLYSDLARVPAAADPSRLGVDGSFRIQAVLPVRGVATSGWRGRSFSLGIADSVTVLAASAAQADAAATVIANHVAVDDPRIVRRPACELKDDTDLGSLPVIVDVPALEPEQVHHALRAGLYRARELKAAGLIWEAVLLCQGQIMATDRTGLRAPDSVALPHGEVGSVFA